MHENGQDENRITPFPATSLGLLSGPLPGWGAAVLWICSLRLRLRVQGRAAGEVHRSDRSAHFFSVLLFDNNWGFLSPRES